MKRKTSSSSASIFHYHLFNGSLFFILALVFIYSIIYKAGENAHPLPSVYTWLTGLESPGTGLSRAFSEIVRGNFDKANSFNPHAEGVFFFFLYLSLSRIGISIFLETNKRKPTVKSINQTVTIDGIVALALFAWTFFPFITWFLRVATAI